MVGELGCQAKGFRLGDVKGSFEEASAEGWACCWQLKEKNKPHC